VHRKKHIKVYCLLSTIFCLYAGIFSVQANALNSDDPSYEIDTQNSYIHIYTGSQGLLKSVSHKHLIAIKDITINSTIEFPAQKFPGR